MRYFLNNDLITSGRILSRALSEIKKYVKPGCTAKELDLKLTDFITKSGAKGAFVGYNNYPYFSCVSVNNTIVHGIPSDYSFKPSDIVGVDVGVNYQGWITDGAITLAIPPCNAKLSTALRATKLALDKAIYQAKPGNRVGDISWVIQKTAKQNNLSIAMKLTGHGLGKKIHEPPPIPNIGQKNSGPLLEEGMVIAIEPMFAVSAGRNKQPLEVPIHTLKDGWSVGLPKGYIGIHFEHTVYISKKQPLILTDFI